MKKKIKNSSFMNLIWFVLAILPIALIFVYSLSFMNKEEKEITGTEYNTYDNLVSVSTTDYVFNDYNSVIVNNYWVSSLASANYTNFFCSWSIDNSTYENLYLYFYISNYTFTDEYLSLSVGDLTISDSISSNFNVYHLENVSISSDFVLMGFLSSINNFVSDVNVKLFASIESIDITEDLMINSDMFNIAIPYTATYNLYNNYEDYISMYKLSFSGFGFIATALINLVALFGISNTYSLIACYYIEYLVLITLLKIAFDLLTMLPNICHNFMEKIGGERE